jgi:hypothetical protein
MHRVLPFVLLLASPFVAAARQPFGVCPPFPLRDEAGNVINPVANALLTRFREIGMAIRT